MSDQESIVIPEAKEYKTHADLVSKTEAQIDELEKLRQQQLSNRRKAYNPLLAKFISECKEDFDGMLLPDGKTPLMVNITLSNSKGAKFTAPFRIESIKDQVYQYFDKTTRTEKHLKINVTKSQLKKLQEKVPFDEKYSDKNYEIYEHEFSSCEPDTPRRSGLGFTIDNDFIDIAVKYYYGQ